ncbi:pentatricopeptide repeat-containing protein At3g48250, chloroplastic [Rhododendron vialii]|uniref:pentatricopeptide repeat-containing protein At3g48250, chloroplastic n=1 Tax=Rhododendron vialii TaxID=182163 RepID=UPI0026603195|nr:pentatricopeptide repeat-containing protein At3g48250, chloroplastic [Rhododendron vialii]
MNRAKTILSHLRLLNSLHSTRLYPQVPIPFSHLSPSLSKQPHASISIPTYQILSFSTQPTSILELIADSDWSKELENKLSNTNPKLTHETVVYILKKLDKDPKRASKFFNWVCDKNGFRPSSAIYSLVLRIFANKESVKQFWATITKMKELGFYIDEATYLTVLGVFRNSKMGNDVTAWTQLYNKMVKENEMSDVVKMVVGVVTSSDWGREVERDLGEMEILLSDGFVLRVLKELRGYPLKALSFFKWVGGCTGYEHNSVTYNAVARVLGRDDSIGEFWSMVKEMQSLGHEMDIDTYIKISRQFQKNKMLKDAVELYELMMDGPYKPSAQDCGVLLRTISVGGNATMDLVYRVVDKHEAAGNVLTKSDYDGIHRALTSVGRFDEAEKIVETMRKLGHKPDNITYSQLVFGLCKARRLEEASKVLDLMEANGCIPDIKTWTILIKGHCAANEVDKALFCFANMMEKNCDADADLLDVLVNGFISQNRIEGANQLVVEMVNKVRLRPWQATYKSLIQRLLEKRKFEEALNLLHLMKKHNYPPSPEPFVHFIARFGTVEDAGDFLKALSGKEYPSISAYLHLFKAFFQEGRDSEAKDLLFKCPHHIRKHEAICSLFGSAKSSNAAAA